MKSALPYFTCGTIVVKPEDEATVEKLPASIDQGVYYGWAQLLTKTENEIYKMVTSIGNNPFYNNTKKTIETHMMHEFSNDLYAERIKLVLLGKIRPMKTFPTRHELIMAIQQDISMASSKLDSDSCRRYLSDQFFQK
ncbi:unnamed protein product [Adineta ricciae]|uniref:riboflavin kinase n=1 Tax=Adineta ricciae TaxID=249248 RepID=A0A813Z3A5_ADIRI|nr:unnamed protein product [Adineta ricciae]